MPFPHLAAISRKNKIHTQIQFPERPWRNENLFGFQEYHLCPDPRHFLIDSGGRGQSDECINLLSPMFAWLSDQPVISPGWPGLADHGNVYPGQTNTGLDHLTSNTSLLVIVLHRRRHTYFDSHGQSITQKAWDNMWHCVWHWGCWHWSLDGARWPWYWPWGPGVWPHWRCTGWRARDNGIISVMRRRIIRRRGSVLGETGAGHHQVNTDHHDTFRVEQMFELTQIYSIRDK